MSRFLLRYVGGRGFYLSSGCHLWGDEELQDVMLYAEIDKERPTWYTAKWEQAHAELVPI